MRVACELLIEAAPETLWRLLWDVPRMAACVPGCAEAEEVTPHRTYRARLAQKVGPVSLSVPLAVEILAADAPNRLILSASGRDPVVGTDIAIRVTLDCRADGAGTRLRIGAEGRVLGKLGALGRAVVQRKAEETVGEFGRRLACAARS
jgi:carbon monoxide dehydrogenase subunit G